MVEEGIKPTLFCFAIRKFSPYMTPEELCEPSFVPEILCFFLIFRITPRHPVIPPEVLFGVWMVCLLGSIPHTKPQEVVALGCHWGTGHLPSNLGTVDGSEVPYNHLDV